MVLAGLGGRGAEIAFKFLGFGDGLGASAGPRFVDAGETFHSRSTSSGAGFKTSLLG
jgi:hypothetical protein